MRCCLCFVSCERCMSWRLAARVPEARGGCSCREAVRKCPSGGPASGAAAPQLRMKVKQCVSSCNNSDVNVQPLYRDRWGVSLQLIWPAMICLWTGFYPCPWSAFDIGRGRKCQEYGRYDLFSIIRISSDKCYTDVAKASITFKASFFF